ncbi:hypothetical protein Gogos_012088 [Gossypium gossypioides]|uniref:Uncharacterized protein n=1 Tax=Gossypium gossypioides TaxID=34282 RepID=A0A7J9BRH1_GOSGO|nr:hypothetical protein [Gossypium gossypioides]
MGRIIASRSHLAFAKVYVEVPVDMVIPRFITVILRDGSLTSLIINVSWMPLSHCVFELSLFALEKGKAIVVSHAPLVKKQVHFACSSNMFDILNVELPKVSDVIVDDFVVFGSMADGSNLVAVDPGSMASLNGHVATTTQMDTKGYLRPHRESVKGLRALVKSLKSKKKGIGDFNVTLFPEECSRLDGTQSYTSNMEEFRDCVSLLKLLILEQ